MLPPPQAHIAGAYVPYQHTDPNLQQNPGGIAATPSPGPGPVAGAYPPYHEIDPNPRQNLGPVELTDGQRPAGANELVAAGSPSV